MNKFADGSASHPNTDKWARLLEDFKHVLRNEQVCTPGMRLIEQVIDGTRKHAHEDVFYSLSKLGFVKFFAFMRAYEKALIFFL